MAAGQNDTPWPPVVKKFRQVLEGLRCKHSVNDTVKSKQGFLYVLM
jgi:hypothetical protein